MASSNLKVSPLRLGVRQGKLMARKERLGVALAGRVLHVWGGQGGATDAQTPVVPVGLGRAKLASRACNVN